MDKRKKTMIYPYIPAMINHVERKLSKMAKDGWELVDFSGWRFSFEKTDPREKEYFMYFALDLSNGFFEGFYEAKTKYAKRKSKISKAKKCIFEIDPDEKDEMFERAFRLPRNRYYFSHYKKLAFLAAIFSIIASIPVFSDIRMLLLFIPCVLILLYSSVSLLILRHDMKKVRTER